MLEFLLLLLLFGLFTAGLGLFALLGWWLIRSHQDAPYGDNRHIGWYLINQVIIRYIRLAYVFGCLWVLAVMYSTLIYAIFCDSLSKTASCIKLDTFLETIQGIFSPEGLYSWRSWVFFLIFAVLSYFTDKYLVKRFPKNKRSYFSKTKSTLKTKS